MRSYLAGFLFLGWTALGASDYPGAPASVVAGYIEADGAGLALSHKTSSQVLRYTTWKKVSAGGPAIVIKSYEIGEVGWTGNEARVQIIYEALGRLDGSDFSLSPAHEKVVFAMEKIGGRWKITDPQLAPHLFVPAAIAAFEAIASKKNDSTMAALEQLRKLE